MRSITQNENKEEDDFNPRIVINIYSLDGKPLRDPYKESLFKLLFENPLHYRKLVFSQPRLCFAVLWRYNSILYANNTIYPKDFVQRMAQTVLLLPSKKGIHNIWQYYGAIESCSLVISIIYREWSSTDFAKLFDLDLSEVSSIIFIRHIFYLFRNGKFKQSYFDYLNDRTDVWRPGIYTKDVVCTYKSEVCHKIEEIIKESLLIIPSTILDEMERYFKLLSYNKIKCGNSKCKKNYLKDQYQLSVIPVETLSKFNRKHIENYLKQLYKKWENKQIHNEWRICKRCQRVRYCSRKCQKISWNKQEHGKDCFRMFGKDNDL